MNAFQIRFPAWGSTGMFALYPWPRGWYTASPSIRLRCVFDGKIIPVGERLWCTGKEGEVFCTEHAHYVS